MQPDKTSRRTFLKTTGCLTIGFSLFGCGTIGTGETIGAEPLMKPDEKQVNAWLRILEDGRIEVITGKIELGQGIRTAIRQVAADELNTALHLVSIRMAETGYTPDEGYTAGSRSIESSAMSVRNAAATAREELLKLASELTDGNDLQVKDGAVLSGTKRISFTEILSGKQIEKQVERTYEIRGKSVRNYVGQPIPRDDISKMVRGELTYVQDLRFPGMVHARVVQPAGYDARLESLDTSGIDENEHLIKVVTKGSFVAVVADAEYEAIRMSKVLRDKAKWTQPSALPSEPLKNHLLKMPTADDIAVDEGDINGADQEENEFVKSTYFKPYIMHGANGPSCAVAKYENGTLDVWTHSQGVYPLRRSLAKMVGLKESVIHITGVHGSGCYGHNAADDVAAEAALIAMELPGKPVRLQWMREDEHGWEPYGTAMVTTIEASLKDGKIDTWKCDLWSDGHSTRPGGSADTLLPARYLDQGFGKPGPGYPGGAVRNATPYYVVPNLQVNSHIFSGPLRTSSLRGLGAYANIYAMESFMDELAYTAKADPVEFRLKHLTDERAIACINRVREMVNGTTAGANEGIGYAFSRYKNRASYFAAAALVSVDRTSGKPRVLKLWGVIDSGECINPDGLKNISEGGMIQSASWCLLEQVSFDQQHITSLDWSTYPILRANEVPEVEVEVIDRVNEEPLGAGEAAQGPTTAAILNAIFDATGVRIKDLPVDASLLKQG